MELSASATLQSGAPRGLALYVAVYESRLSNAVKAGENAGKIESNLSLPLGPGWKQADLGVAAFVQDREREAGRGQA